VTSNNF